MTSINKVHPVLELRSISKAFATHTAVDSVSFTVNPGEFFALVGPSGCGKTTMLRMIAGLEEPSSGEIWLHNQNITQQRAFQRNVSTVFQSYALFPHLTAAENVAFGLERRKTPKPEAKRLVEEALALVRMSDKADRKPQQLSGGERQRIAVARSIVLRPAALLLDEPLCALDPKLRCDVRSELRAMQRQTGIAFLFVTHDQDEALSMSDTIGVMNQGSLEQVGSPQELYRYPASQFVAEFLGAVNWISAVGVRPSCVKIAQQRPTVHERCVAATIETFQFFGHTVRVHARLSDGTPCTADLSENNHRFCCGENIYLSWNAADELTPSVRTSRQ